MSFRTCVATIALLCGACSPVLNSPYTASTDPTPLIPTTNAGGGATNQIRAKPQPTSGQKSGSNYYKLTNTAAAQVPTNYAGSQIATSQGFKLQGGVAHAQ